MKTVSIIVPVYNESQRLGRTLTALKGVRSSMNNDLIKIAEIVFVNDGSTDDTLDILLNAEKNLAKKSGAEVNIYSYDTNKGKGHAVREGMLHAKSDYALLMDADIATPLSEIRKFGSLMQLGTDIIIGTRKVKVATIHNPQPIHRQVLGQAFTHIANAFLGTSVSDFTCGFKLFSRKAYNELFQVSRINTWGYDSELMFLARKKEFPVYEMPVRWSHIHGSKVSVFKNIFSTFKELMLIRTNSLLGHYSGKIQSRLAFSSLLS